MKYSEWAIKEYWNNWGPENIKYWLSKHYAA